MVMKTIYESWDDPPRRGGGGIWLRDGEGWIFLIFMEGLQTYNAGSGLVEILQKDLFFLVVVGVFFFWFQKKRPKHQAFVSFSKNFLRFISLKSPGFFTNMFSGFY